MIRLLFIAYNFPPLNTGGVARSLKMAKFLPDFAIRPIILTQSCTGPEFMIDADIVRVRDFARTGPDDRLKTTVRIRRKTSRWLGRYFSSCDLWRQSVERRAEIILEQTRPDIILASFPPAAGLELGLVLSRQARIPLIPDFRDGLVFEPVGPGQKLRIIREFHERLENEVAANSSDIIAVSEPISEYFRRQYGSVNVQTITNGYDPADFQELPHIPGLDHDKFNIVYTGRLSLSDLDCDATPFFDALFDLVCSRSDLANKIHLHMIGDFTRREISDINRLVDFGAATIQGMVDRKTCLAYQKAADLLLLVTSLGRKSVITGKLYEYLYAGRPIIGLTKETAAEDIINKTGSGWTVSPRNMKGIKNLMTAILSEPGLAGSLHPDQELISRYAYPRQVEKLAQLIRDCLRRRYFRDDRPRTKYS